MSEPLLEIKEVHVEFEVRDGTVHAVDGISYTVNRGETIGIIGESGCGKSVTAKAAMQMLPKPGKVTGGEILYHRRDKFDPSKPTEVVNITHLHPDGKVIRSIRGGEFAMIFQEPMSSLTPVYTTGTLIGEALHLHRKIPVTVGEHMSEQISKYRAVTKEEAREIAIDMLQKVGIPKPHERVDVYPHQLSGGQRQRVMIAIALSCEPFMLIADEPTTALDVSIEAQILDLMRELQSNTEMSIMFITHNLGVIAEMSDDVIVMYMGDVVESADVDSLFYDPHHPYTRMLLKSIPQVGKKSNKLLQPIKGIVPDPFNIPQGCPFWPRCPSVMPGVCDSEEPASFKVDDGHEAKCHLYR